MKQEVSMRGVIAIFVAIAFTLPALSQNNAAAVSVDDVVKLHKAGISEAIIIARIKQANQPAQLSTDDLVKLGQAKVPDGVIQALMTPGPGPAGVAVAPTAAPPPAPAANVAPGRGGRGAAPNAAANDAVDTTAVPATTNPN